MTQLIFFCVFKGAVSSKLKSSFDMQDLKAFEVNTLVRVCAATYDKTPVEQEGIRVLVSDKHHGRCFLSSCVLI